MQCQKLPFRMSGLSPSHGHTVILVIVDRLSKYEHFMGMSANFTSQKVVEVFI